MMELREFFITILLQGQHLAEVCGKRLLRPMVKLCHTVRADLFDRCVQIGFRKAIRFCFRHFIGFGAFIIHFIHPFHDPIQDLLLAGIMLIQSSFRDPQPSGDIIHRCSEISVLRK